MTEQRIVSLFDVDDVSSFGPVREMTVGHVSVADVNEFARRWHYSHGGGSALWRYGLFDGFTLVGVVAYNLPSREACGVVFGPEFAASVVHMGRLVCADDAPRNTESRLIGESLKMLAKDRPDTRAVLTYAAQDQGHLGYVYQATNAIYTGVGGRYQTYTSADGTHISTKGKSSPEGRTKLLAAGGAVARALPRHRYVYLLGNKTERKESRRLLKLPVLPYPKESR
jgi:hypothetical protein